MSTTTVNTLPGAQDLDAELTAALQVVDDVNSAWADNDIDRFAGLYTSDASFILSGDRFFKGREQIHTELAKAFSGEHSATRSYAYVVYGRIIAPNVAALITEGGVLLPGQEEPDWERALRATWTVVKESDGKWRIAAYQNGRRADGALKAADKEH